MGATSSVVGDQIELPINTPSQAHAPASSWSRHRLENNNKSDHLTKTKSTTMTGFGPDIVSEPYVTCTEYSPNKEEVQAAMWIIKVSTLYK